jgi:ribosomal protein S25
MAGGWTRDGAVQDQIDDTVKDAVLRARALTPSDVAMKSRICLRLGRPAVRFFAMAQ